MKKEYLDVVRLLVRVSISRCAAPVTDSSRQPSGMMRAIGIS